MHKAATRDQNHTTAIEAPDHPTVQDQTKIDQATKIAPTSEHGAKLRGSTRTQGQVTPTGWTLIMMVSPAKLCGEIALQSAGYFTAALSIQTSKAMLGTLID